MNNVMHARRRRLLLMLPVLVIPFITLAFWALGGGQKVGNNEEENKAQGLNLELPAANLKQKGSMDKLAFYEKARRDSMKFAEWIRSDPYYNKDNGAEA